MKRILYPVVFLSFVIASPFVSAQFNEQFTFVGPIDTLLYDPVDGTGSAVFDVSVIENPGAPTFLRPL